MSLMTLVPKAFLYRCSRPEMLTPYSSARVATEGRLPGSRYMRERRFARLERRSEVGLASTADFFRTPLEMRLKKMSV